MQEPHTSGAFPIHKPPVSPEERLNHARHVLDSVRLPKRMPPGFDPCQATPEELQLHGLPPRPVNAPDQEAMWKQLMSEMKNAELVVPEFEIVQHDKVPLKVNGDPEARNWTGDNWAGAVIPRSVFSQTMAKWIVPNPVPGKGDGRSWYSTAWVGIDGWTSPDVLQGGTGHDVFKASNGRISRDIYAWFEWYPAYPIRLKNFTVGAGDRVTCQIRAISNTTANFYIYNFNNHKYASVDFKAPVGIILVGDSAEWIVEDPSETVPEENFKVVQFDDCQAVRNGAYENLSSAETVVSTSEDGSFCTAEIKSDTTLVVTYHA